VGLIFPMIEKFQILKKLNRFIFESFNSSVSYSILIFVFEFQNRF